METKFGDILLDRRNRVGMTQEELANKIDVSHTYISKLERNKINPRFSLIEKIYDGLGLTPEEFFGGREETKSEPAILEIYRGKESKKIKEYRIKAKLVPVKVFKGLNTLSRERNIELDNDFTPKYIYVEEGMIDRPQNIIGVEIDKDIILSSIRFRKIIFLVDKKKKDLKAQGMYIIQLLGSKDLSVMRVERDEDKIIFFKETSTLKRKTHSYFQKEYKIYTESEIESDMVRGKVVGIFGSL